MWNQSLCLIRPSSSCRGLPASSTGYEQVAVYIVRCLLPCYTNDLAIHLFPIPEPSMSVAENQKRTAQAFVAACNEYTAEGVLKLRHEDCRHALLPASMGIPERTNAEYLEMFDRLGDLLQGFHVRFFSQTPLSYGELTGCLRWRLSGS